jgi:hypothetical protein
MPNPESQEFRAQLMPYFKATTPAVAGLALGNIPKPVVSAFLPGMALMYVVDEPRMLRFVSEEDLIASKMSLPEMHALALANLRERARSGLRVEAYGPIFAVFIGGHFEATTLLLDELWDEWFKSRLDGDLVAVVPARDVVAVGSASSPSAVQELSAVARRTWSVGEHLLLEHPVVRRKAAWQPLGEHH